MEQEERGSHRPARTSGTTEVVESLPPNVTRLRLAAQEQRDLELARQFEAFGVFASTSQSRDKSSSSSSLPLHQTDLQMPQQGRDITVSSGSRIQVNMQPPEPSGLKPSADVLTELQGMESSVTREQAGPRVSSERSRHSEQRRSSNSGISSSWPQGQESNGNDRYRNQSFTVRETTIDGPRISKAPQPLQLKLPPTQSQPPTSIPQRLCDTLPSRAAGTDDPFAYARQLQEEAFKSLQQHDLTRDDRELARKMQELEDSGLGRLNSGRKLSDDDNGEEGFSEDSGDEGGRSGFGPFFSADGSMVPKSSQQDEDEKLARYMQGGGASIRNLSRQAVNQLLGQESAKLAPESVATSTAFSTAASPSNNHQPASSFSSVGPTNNATVFAAQSLVGDVFLDLPQREKPDKKKKGKKMGFLGFGRSEKKAPPPQPFPPSRQVADLASAVPSAIPPPPVGPPCSPRRLSRIVGEAIDPTSPTVSIQQHNAITSPHSAPSTGRRTTTGHTDWTPSSPRKLAPRSDLNARSLSPLPATHRPGPLPHSVSVSRDITKATTSATFTSRPSLPLGGRVVCANCRQSGGSFVAALDKTYHVECFKCLYCNERIDPASPFSFSRDNDGEKHPYHRKCYSELYGVTCAVCSERIPSNVDGTVTFVKHPFFDTEQMCLHHAETPGRRCTGCHRFEPIRAPFADLNDGDRCVCFSCCRTVVVDNSDVTPLWDQVLDFFAKKLNLPVWKEMRDIPILVVQSDALDDQLRSDNAHYGSSQIMARGLCLTDHDHNRRFKLPSMRFINSSRSFQAVEELGYTYFEVPESCRGNPSSNVFAILCLSGLPRDLTMSVLAHEATHAWIKLHPKYDARKPLPAQVEEGCAQLMAMLLLTDGLDPPDTTTDTSEGPSDEKLRQYFKFSIERDQDDVYGGGYRRAARAYSDIGIEALLSHVVRYRTFPST